jgi:hypothetical protein
VCGTFSYNTLNVKALYFNAGAMIFVGVMTFVLFRTPLCFFEDPLAPSVPSSIASETQSAKLRSESNQATNYGSLSSLVELDQRDETEMKRF